MLFMVEAIKMAKCGCNKDAKATTVKPVEKDTKKAAK
jgi:hypothetical protein